MKRLIVSLLIGGFLSLRAGTAAAEREMIFIDGRPARALSDLPSGPGSTAWQAAIGSSIYSSPSVADDGTVLVGADDGKLHAFHSNGTRKWSFETKREVRTAPLIASDGTIYSGSLDGNFYALSAEGALRWHYVSTYDNLSFQPAEGFDGQIIARFNRLMSFKPAGEPEWELPLINLASAPLVGTDGMIYVAAEKLVAVRPDGTVHWQVELERPVGFRGSLLAMGADGVIYAGASWDKDYRVLAVHSDGTIKWSFAGLDAVLYGSPVATEGGAVYVGTGAGSIICLGPNGTLTWQKSFASRGAVSPTLTKTGLVVVAHEAGAVMETDRAGNELWRRELGSALGLPAVTDSGRIYVGTLGGTLYALDGESGLAASAWPIAAGDVRRTSRARGSSAPPVPANVTVSQGTYPGKVLIEWESAAKASSYQIWRADTNDPGSATLIAGNITKETSFFDRSATGAVTYWYWVVAETLVADSGFGAGVSGYAATSGSGEPWELALGVPVSYSSPAVGSDGTIFVGAGGVPHPISGSLQGTGKLFAVHPDGTTKWEFKIGNYGESSPAIAPDGTVYIGTGYTSFIESGKQGVMGRVFAIRPDGSMRWEFEGPGQFFSPAAIDKDGTIYIGSHDQYLHAFNPDGTEKWRFPTGWWIASGVAIAADGTIYLGAADQRLYALNSAGELKWSFDTWGVVGTPAIGSDGTIYVGAGAGLHRGGPGDRRLYAIHPDGSLKWAYETGGPIGAAPAIGPDGTIYIGSTDHHLHAVNRDGTGRWSFLTGGPVNSSPAIDADGVIYFGSDDKKLYALNPDGTLRSQYLTGGAVRSSPVLGDDGRVYFGSTDQHLHAAKAAGPLSDGPWPMFGHDARHTGRDSTASLPPAPSGVSASKNEFTNQVAIRWQTVPGRPSYEIWRHTSDEIEGATRIAQFISDATHFVDTTTAAGTVYYYWVRARNSLGAGAFSASDSGYRPIPPVGGLIWAFPAGHQVHGSPAVAPDGTIYVGSTITNAWIDAASYLYALNSNGTFKWKYEMGNRVFSSPAIAGDGTIYVGCNDYRVYSFNPDGTLRWTFTSDLGRFGAFISSPAVAEDGTVYVGCTDNHLYAITPEGALKWAFRTAPDHTTSPVNSSPAIGPGGIVYVGAGYTLFAFNPDGTLLWSAGLDHYVDSSPAVDRDGTIYVGTAPWGGAKDPGSVYAINTDGTVRWRYSAGAVRSSPVLGADGTIYFGDEQNTFHALHPDGTAKWVFQSGGSISSTAAVAEDGTVYFGSTDSMLYALNPAGEKAWEFETGGAIYSSPAIGSGGTVYFGSYDGNLYFLRGSSPLAETPWPKFRRDTRHQARSPFDLAPPGTPTRLSATKGTVLGTVRLNWDSAPWAASYEVWRGSTDDFAGASRIAEKISSRTTYDDTSAQFETRYYYWVRAVNATGVSARSDADWGYQDFKKWDFIAEGSINSSPALGANGTIYFGSNGKYDPARRANDGKLYAVDRSGRKLWEFTAQGAVASSPAIGDDGTIYFGAADKNVYALWPDGSLKWAFTTGGLVNSSPAIGSDGTIYVGSNDKKLYAIRPDGTKFWEFVTSGTIYSSPAIGPDGTIYVGSYGNQFYAIHPNGTKKWSHLSSDGVGSSPAVGSSGTVYFQAYRGNVIALGIDGSKLWEHNTTRSSRASPSIDGVGKIYIGAGDGKMRCFNPDGTLNWEQQLDGWIASAPAIAADGSLFIGSGSKVYRLDAQGSVLWEFTAGGAIDTSSPVLDSDGTVYVAAADGKLYALKGNAAAADGQWPMFRHDARHTGSLAAPAVPPRAPEGVVASRGRFVERVRISWTAQTGPETTGVWRSTSLDAATAVKIAEGLIGVSVFDDVSVEPGVTYSYWLQSRNASGVSPLSAAASGFAAPQSLEFQVALESKIASQIAVAPDGTLYVGANDGKLYSVSKFGKVQWTFDAGNRLNLLIGSDGVIYMTSVGGLLAVGADGQLKWRYSSGVMSDVAPASGRDGTLYVGYQTYGIAAISATGELLWSFRTTHAVRSSPSVGTDGTIYFGSGDGHLYALNPDGTVRWKFLVGTSVTASPIIGDGGVIYIRSSDKHLYAIDSSGALKTKFPTANYVEGHPSIGPDGTIYMGSQGVRPLDTSHQLGYPLYAVSPTGTERWKYVATGVVVAPAIDGSNTVYVGDSQGLAALNAHGAKQWTFITETNTVGIPVIDRTGTVYFSAGNKIYGIATGNPPADGAWPMYRHDARHSARAVEPVDPPPEVDPLRLDGRVEYYAGNQGVPGVSMSLRGSSSSETTTAEDGTFELKLSRTGTSSLVPSKTSDTPASQGVSTLDVTMVRRHILGIAAFDTPPRLLAADVDGSSSVSTLDISLMRRLILGVANEYSGAMWRFVSADSGLPDAQSPWFYESGRSYTNPKTNAANQNFIAIKLGDVNGSWVTPGAVLQSGAVAGSSVGTQLAGFEGPELRLISKAVRETSDGRVVAVAVAVSRFHRVAGMQFTLEWDSKQWSFVRAHRFALPEMNEEHFGYDFVLDGRMTFSWDDPAGTGVTLSESSEILELEMLAKGSEPMNAVVRFTDEPTPRELVVDGLMTNGTTMDTDGRIRSIMPVAPLVQVNIQLASGFVTLTVPTDLGQGYAIEFTDSLNGGIWRVLEEFTGDGETKAVRETGVLDSSRFYRVRLVE